MDADEKNGTGSHVSVEAMSPPRFSGKQRIILLILLGAGFMVSVDFSILNVALPETGAGIGMEVAQLPWITAAYALPSAGFALLFGRFADLFGRRKLFMASMVVLTVASLLGGFATNPEVLLAARALQGLATAMALPAALSLLTTTFAEGAIRDRALGLNGALLSGGFTIGALVGGALVSLLSWRAAFLINVPVTALILVATPFVISESRMPERVKLDLPGAATVTGGLLAVVYAIIERSVVAAVVGLVLLAAFWMIELRAAAPLTPVRTLARPTVKWGNFAGLVVFGMETAMIFMLTLYLQNVLELSPLVTGLIFGVPGLAAVLAGPIAGRSIGRHGPRKVLTAGMAVQGLATLPLIFLGGERIGLALLIPALFISFFGHVTAIVAYTITGTSGLPDDEQGLATGLTSMTQQVGITVGIPVLSAIAATQASELPGIHLALIVNVVVTLAAAGLVWFGLGRRGAPVTATPADHRDGGLS
jgi:MFS family permease